MRRSSSFFAVISLLLFTACDCSADKVAPGNDAAIDASETDSGQSDASSNTIDAGDDADVDAGDPDSGTADAGGDAGGSIDAGSDAGGDAGTITDAGSDAAVDAGPPSCKGTRPACSTLAGVSCTGAGCMTVNGGTCGGTESPCSTYNGNAGKCFGSGCNYSFGSGACTGTPTPCAQVNLNFCGTSFGPTGCSPSNACTGTADPCSTYTNMNQCALQVGCSWM